MSVRLEWLLDNPDNRSVVRQTLDGDGIQILFNDDEALRVFHKARVDARPRLSRLSPAQRDAAELMVEGLQNKVIVHQPNSSIRTIENHRLEIMRRVETRTLVSLARLFILAG